MVPAKNHITNRKIKTCKPSARRWVQAGTRGISVVQRKTDASVLAFAGYYYSIRISATYMRMEHTA